MLPSSVFGMSMISAKDNHNSFFTICDEVHGRNGYHQEVVTYSERELNYLEFQDTEKLCIDIERNGDRQTLLGCYIEDVRSLNDSIFKVEKFVLRYGHNILCEYSPDVYDKSGLFDSSTIQIQYITNSQGKQCIYYMFPFEKLGLKNINHIYSGFNGLECVVYFSGGTFKSFRIYTRCMILNTVDRKVLMGIPKDDERGTILSKPYIRLFNKTIEYNGDGVRHQIDMEEQTNGIVVKFMKDVKHKVGGLKLYKTSNVLASSDENKTYIILEYKDFEIDMFCKWLDRRTLYIPFSSNMDIFSLDYKKSINIENVEIEFSGLEEDNKPYEKGNTFDVYVLGFDRIIYTGGLVGAFHYLKKGGDKNYWKKERFVFENE